MLKFFTEVFNNRIFEFVAFFIRKKKKKKKNYTNIVKIINFHIRKWNYFRPLKL